MIITYHDNEDTRKRNANMAYVIQPKPPMCYPIGSKKLPSGAQFSDLATSSKKQDHGDTGEQSHPQQPTQDRCIC